MIYSYLKHVECCRIIQTNWKTSGKWKTTEYDEQQAKILFDKLKKSNSFKNIFGKNDFSQLIKQAEIDVIGLNTSEDSIFGVDVAFHTSGLNYKGNEESTNKVLMKILRTVLIMQTYFSKFNKFNSYFVAPKVSPGVVKSIEKLLVEAKEIINDDMISIKFIANDDFYTILYQPLIDSFKDEHDTSELFSRTIKLIELNPRLKTMNSSKIPLGKDSTKCLTSSPAKRTENGMLIGQYIQFEMKRLHENRILSKEEIDNLQKKEYSKKVFKQNYEILRRHDMDIKDGGGRNRYYSTERFFNDKYYLTSQWVEHHWVPFLKWLEKVNDKKNS